MKRLLLSLAFALITAATFAQTTPKMELKPFGFASAADSTKNFVVLEVPKLKQSDLYNKTLTYLNGLYKNPSQVISSVDGESITVNGYTNDVQGTFKFHQYPFTYNIVFQFKDGKIKYQPRFIKLMEVPETMPAKEIYLKNTDSSKPHEINAIFFKSNRDGFYYPLKDSIQENLSSWANSYLNEIKKSLSDNW
ncbi:DUF4468 domain-containing protein [Pedobacter lithocola]|uniref:DUF4468 domain-containing protein n=1 Tax=Pedobacter lithocola TaxID=1908239 RepID=A0ABV8PHF6_9SPHI